MFSDYFAPEPAQLDLEASAARRRRQREVENALLSHLMSGFRPTREALIALQSYINGEKPREKAFRTLYEVH